MPPAKHFYDLFCGGCAVTHGALLSGKWKNIHYRDKLGLPVYLFSCCINGKAPEPRWVSREDFYEQRRTDPYVACCYSFGADWNTYAFSHNIEPIKKAFHYAVVDLDFSLAKGFGLDLEFLRGIPNWYARYQALKHHFEARVPEMVNIERLQHLEKLAALKDIQGCDGVSMFPGVGDYRDADIPTDSVVYCDPPYKDTKAYYNSKFDSEEFYNWCRTREFPVFISEYAMPSDFIPVLELSHYTKRAPFVAHNTIERLFVHESHYDIVMMGATFV